MGRRRKKSEDEIAKARAAETELLEKVKDKTSYVVESGDGGTHREPNPDKDSPRHPDNQPGPLTE